MKQENIVNLNNLMNLEVLQIASNNSNNKVVKNFTHYSKYKNSVCGDQIEITLKLKMMQLLILVTSRKLVFTVRHQQA